MVKALVRVFTLDGDEVGEEREYDTDRAARDAIRSDAELHKAFGGNKLQMWGLLEETTVPEVSLQSKAREALKEQGWSDEDIDAALTPQAQDSEESREEPKEEKPAQAQPTEEPEDPKAIPEDWDSETRVTVLRKYAKIVAPDEPVSRWTREACKAAIRRYLAENPAPWEPSTEPVAPQPEAEQDTGNADAPLAPPPPEGAIPPPPTSVSLPDPPVPSPMEE